MAKYQILREVPDPFDLMCSDCPVTSIQYFEDITEQELREEHQEMLGADASIPDWEQATMREEFDWEPTEADFDKWLQQCIAEGYVKEVV